MELSSTYDVGRNTAREALRALAGQGLLTIKRGVAGRTFVAVPSLEHVSGALHTGIAVLTDSKFLSLSSLLEAIRESLYDPKTIVEPDGFVKNRDFHAQLLAASHNPLLEVISQPLFRMLRERFTPDRAEAGFLTQVHADHLEIAGYLSVRDQAGAREAARAHLPSMRRLYESVVASS